MSDGTFYVKHGHFVTLAEMLRFGMQSCSCFNIYRTYVNLPVYAYKKFHSRSGSEAGRRRQNAKLLHWEMTGRYALPNRPW